MSLPNYVPDGIIYLGNVPWDNSYSDVRLYKSLSDQQGDILQRLTMTSEDYVYIGRNRRIKLSIPADRLYHANYCAYRNRSISQGWVYCFITDVEYVNDNTSEITVETDVFQTYLYGVDWDVPACMVDRETVREEEKYLLTAEDDFPLAYVVDGESDVWFQNDPSHPETTVTVTASQVYGNGNIAQAVLNPEGYYTEQIDIENYKGVPQGNALMVHKQNQSLQTYLDHLQKAGGTDSIEAIFVAPDFLISPWNGLSTKVEYIIDDDNGQDNPDEYEKSFVTPRRGSSCDGYTPKNRKMLYFPYTFVRLTDYNGSSADLRYEFFDSVEVGTLGIKSAVNPLCEAIVYPLNYDGQQSNLDNGFVTKCGAQCSWTTSGFNSFLSSNAASIAVTAGGVAATFIPGKAAVSASAKLMHESKALKNAGFDAFSNVAKSDARKNMVSNTLGKGLQQGGAILAAKAPDYLSQSNAPNLVKGQVGANLMFQTGTQGVHALRMTLKAEFARQIDDFFTMYGYKIEQLKKPELFTRSSWNYVKTIGAVAKSKSVTPSANAVHTRGAGTPASALALIASIFDAGVTFWHTTDGFGDYSLDNSIIG